MIHAFSFAVAFRRHWGSWFELDAKGRENGRQMTFVFPSSVDVQLLELVACLSFDKRETFFELFRDGSRGPVVDRIRMNPQSRFINKEEIVNRFGFNRFREGPTHI
jgi:hypothetical protein